MRCCLNSLLINKRRNATIYNSFIDKGVANDSVLLDNYHIVVFYLIMIHLIVDYIKKKCFLIVNVLYINSI